MATELEMIFARLRGILRQHGAGLGDRSASGRFTLESAPGPATLQASGGKVRRPTIPVAWVEARKSYVSFHLMGLYGNRKLESEVSRELRARMQGKTCFNFKRIDEDLFTELDRVTGQAIAAFRQAGFIGP